MFDPPANDLDPTLVGEIDSSRSVSAAETVDAITAALKFPLPRRHNLNALLDELMDAHWLPPGTFVLRWLNASELRRRDPVGFDAILDVLRTTEERTRTSPRPFRLELVG